MDTRPVLISDISTGGAAIACSRLWRGLRADGLNAQWYTLHGAPGAGAVIAGEWPPVGALLLQRLVSRLRSELMVRRCEDWLGNLTVGRVVKRTQASVINLHSVHEGMSFGLLSHLPKRLPIVWTLHDMWPLTGYCCYSYDCDKYESGCAGTCPQMGRWGYPVTAPSNAWKRRESFIIQSQERFCFVAPSVWMANCARRRFAGKVRVEHIPNGVDVSVFRPLHDRQSACKVLGLPLDRPVFLAGAESLGDLRKGGEILLKAMGIVANSGYPFVVAMFGDTALKPAAANVVYLGRVRDEAFLNLCYNAADCFIHPALADNYPNVILESLASGTPCIVSSAGGSAEAITSGVTGFIFECGNAVDLADRMIEALSMREESKRVMQSHCRKWAESSATLALQAGRYCKLFAEVSR